MLPVMFAARKLDAEDPVVVYWLRVAYGIIQCSCLLVVAYTWLQASALGNKTSIIYVPPAPTVSCLQNKRQQERTTVPDKDYPIA